MVYNDADLVRKALEGEQDAFEALVRKYQDAIYGFAFHLIGDFIEAQDVTQQAFVAAYMKLSQLKDPGKFVPWIKRIAANECALWVRRRQQMLRLHEKMGNPSRPISTPHDEYEEKEIESVVRKAMETLSEKSRLAMTLYYIDGLSQREVGSFLGISTSAVENRISRARKQLKEEMTNMVGSMFEGNRLPDDFTQNVRETLDKAKEAEGSRKYDEALTYSDEALDILSNLPESPEAQKLKKEALWLKGDAAYFSTGLVERLKYHEQALELEEKVGDKRDYADALLRVSRHSGTDRKERTIKYKQKALKIYEEMGDLVKQAEICMWLGGELLFSNERSEEAMAYFQKALDLFGQTQDETMGYESVCRSANRLVEETESLPSGVKRLSCAVASLTFERTSEKLNLTSRPGMFRSVIRKRKDLEIVFKDDALPTMIFNSLRYGDVLLDYGVAVGDTSEMESWSFTLKPLKATRTVESDSETVSVAAGRFTNCLKLRTVITPDPDDDGLERNKGFNRMYNCGTKQTWFAPGVGPVKFIFDKADGVPVHIELTEYSVADGGHDYFPLAVSNKWVYRWTGLDERYVSRDYYEVAFQKGDIYYLDHHAYSYFAGNEEEYQLLREELMIPSPATGS